MVGVISLQNSSLVLSFIEIAVFIFGFFNPKSLRESFFGKITISLFILVNQFSITFAQLKVAMALFPSIKISLYNHSEYFFSNWFKAI
jgi:hypothetical protein